MSNNINPQFNRRYQRSHRNNPTSPNGGNPTRAKFNAGFPENSNQPGGFPENTNPPRVKFNGGINQISPNGSSPNYGGPYGPPPVNGGFPKNPNPPGGFPENPDPPGGPQPLYGVSRKDIYSPGDE